MNRDKTPLMMLLELQYDLPIEKLLAGPATEVAAHLDINKSTVTLWRQKRGVYSTGYCHIHSQKVWDFCRICWLESLGMDSDKAKEVVEEMCQD